MALQITNLHVSVEKKSILHGINLALEKGKVIAVMGPNGSGKSTLANTIAGHPKYVVANGNMRIDGEDITNMKPEERAKRGVFLSMQNTPEIAGVSVANFLRLAAGAIRGEQLNLMKFHKELVEKLKALKIDERFLSRHLNVGFSGGEKKKFEMLQMAVLNPTYAILDETDSGLDVDALRIVAEGINQFKSPEKGILLITHYNRILEYIVPDEVHVMVAGKIIKSGGKELAVEIEKSGYEEIV